MKVYALKYQTPYMNKSLHYHYFGDTLYKLEIKILEDRNNVTDRGVPFFKEPWHDEPFGQYLSTSRAALKKKARELKAGWIKELKEYILAIKQMDKTV